MGENGSNEEGISVCVCLYSHFNTTVIIPLHSPAIYVYNMYNIQKPIPKIFIVTKKNKNIINNGFFLYLFYEKKSVDIFTFIYIMYKIPEHKQKYFIG